MDKAITIFSAKGQFTYNINSKEQLYYNDYNTWTKLLQCLQQRASYITVVTTNNQLYYNEKNKRQLYYNDTTHDQLYYNTYK